MKLNCDLGESFGTWQKGQDDEIMPLIDQANIACGFHASDPLTMQKTVQLAVKHQVSIGAHPAYPDLVGFGRRTMAIEGQELEAIIIYQIGALQAFCQQQGVQLDYVKPHGALYNDMMKNTDLFQHVCRAIASVSAKLKLMIQALPDTLVFQQIASEHGIALYFEAFADRNYQSDGFLVPRSEPNAVITDKQLVIERCQQLMSTGHILDINNQPLAMQIDSLCVHGDNQQALALVKTIRQQMSRNT
ncbi:5-oxoprolinase subunit PxpA [Thalassotalea sp. PLHSN55]|uniref:5-oxoprolinase subunit PxpA n=1 Tax=Thalassotalea sp. PLHSN55 TaxID=3435888 RepID=UPI003F83C6A5